MFGTLYLKKYILQEAMDREIFQQSALAETFEWKTPSSNSQLASDDIDVDLTLMKNLIESQSHGMGNPALGPLANMMAQLGIVPPKPPPMGDP